MLTNRLGTLAAVASLVFTACSGAASPSPQASSPASAAASAPASEAASPSPSGGTPVKGGTWIFASSSDPSTLDAILIQDGESFRIAQQIYETLIKLKPGSATELEPDLATSWDKSQDGLTYTFHLQTGVTFSDGTPFNADAAIYNVNRWKNLPAVLHGDDYYDITVFGGYGNDSLIKTVTKVDDSTFSITLGKAKADFLTAMTLIPFAMQSPKALQDHHADLGTKDPKNDYWQKAPTGTGPFMFKEFVSGDHYTIVRNPNYWDTANQAFLDTIIFKPIADAAQRLTALKSGTVDTIDFVDANQLTDIKNDQSLQLLTRPPLDVGKLAFNQTHKPFDDIKVRQAIAYAIDKKALIDAFFPNGAGTAADSDLINTMPAYEPNQSITNAPDVQKAKDLLASSSCPSPCKVDFWYPDSVSRPYMLDPKGEFEAIRTMLEAVGFQVTPNHKAWHGGYLTEEANGVYPIFFIGWIYDYNDPADGPGIFYATTTSKCNGQAVSKPHNCEFGEDNPSVIDAMNKAIYEPDDAKRTQAWKDAMKLINADVPDVPLVWAGSSLGATVHLHGYVPSPTQSEYFNLVWKDAS